MAKGIDPALKEIGSYLKLAEKTKFVIPKYQRPYSWQIENCDKLWQDVWDYINSKSSDRYFFGTIILSCNNDESIFELIDGQQRTTTFLLLLKALLFRVNTAIGATEQDPESKQLFQGLKERRREIMGILYKAESEEITDKPDKESDQVLIDRDPILMTCSINEHKDYKLELKKILSAMDYTEAQAKVHKIFRKQKDNKFTNYFRNFKFFYEKAGELDPSNLNLFTKTLIKKCEVIEIKSRDVDQAIKMFNSLNSAGLPLYDADIISAYLYSSADQKNICDEYSTFWMELVEILDELKQKRIADINEILMQQMFYILAKNKEIDVTMPGLRRFFTVDKKELLDDPVQLCRQMINLAKIWEKVSEFPIVQVLLKFSDNAKRFLGSYFCRFEPDDVTEENIQEITTCLLRLFTLLELVDTGYSSKEFKMFLFEEIVKMANPDVLVSTIKTDFDRHISGTWTYDGIKQSVKEYEKNILVYLNEYIFDLEHPRPNFRFKLEGKYDIEHIMPRSGLSIDQIREDAEIKNKEDFDEYVNQIGNKIVLEDKCNRGLGNNWFRTKVSKKFPVKNGYAHSKYPIALALVDKYGDADNKPFWTKDDIVSSTEKASERITNFIFDIKEQTQQAPLT